MNMLRAQWMPIFIEPLPFSGERLCAAIAFKADSGEYRVISTLPNHALEALFGVDAPSMRRLAYSLTESLDGFMKTGKAMEQWQPPFDGAETGETRDAVETGWDELVASVVSNIACLSAVPGKEKPSEEDNASTWARDVQSWVIQQDSNLKANFNVAIDFERGTSIVLGFSGPSLAAEFAVINPFQSWGPQSTPFLRRVARLTIARKHGGLFAVPNHEILARIPAVESLSQTAKERLDRSLLEAERMADSTEIRLRTYTEPREAARHILGHG